MTRYFDYPATLTPASNFAPGETGFVVRFADLPEAITQGEDEADAISQATDALDEAIAARMKRGDDIPSPSAVLAGQHLIPVPALTATKAALYLAMRQQHISKVALAGMLQANEKEVRRLLDPHHGSKLPAIEGALLKVGKRLRIVVEDAPADLHHAAG